MAFFVQDKQGAHATDVNQQLDQLEGTGLVAGGEASEGATLYSVNFDAITALVNGNVVTSPATSVDLESFVDANDPRKVIVHIDENGTVDVTPGTPEDPEPSDALRFDTYRPAPPDLSDKDVVPLAEVWLDQRAGQVTSTDIRDRRVYVAINVYSIGTNTIDVEEITDGGGVTHTDELADAADVRTDEEIRTAIDTDPNHGQDASHEYFTGDHKDLVGIQTDQHHARYADSEARAAVRETVDAADLAGSGTSGQVLETNGSAANWADIARAEAPIITEGSFTHTGGSATTVVISGVAPTETSEFAIYFDVDTEASFSGDYAFNTDHSKHWNDANGEWDVDATVTWDTDPGSGNDISIEYTTYNFAPTIVQEKYSDSKAIAAMDGASITPNRVQTSVELKGPVYDALADHPAPSFGDMAIASGDGTDSFGQYVYDGTQWSGPFSSGVSALSGLTIDADKDWGGYSITNLGAPPGDNAAARQIDVDNTVDSAAGNRSSYQFSSGSGTEYLKIAKLTDGTSNENADAFATLLAGKPVNYSNQSITRLAVGAAQSTSSGYWSKQGQGNNRVEFVVTETNGTGQNGYNEYYLYARANDYCDCQISVEHANTFGFFDYVEGLSATDLTGTVIYDTANPPTDVQRVGTLNAGEVYDSGNRVHTDATSPHFTANEAIDANVDTTFSVSIPFTTLKDGDSVTVPITLGSNQDFSAVRMEHRIDGGNSPTGLKMQVLDDGVVDFNEERTINVGSRTTPITTILGSSNIGFRILNSSGATQNVGGTLQYLYTAK